MSGNVGASVVARWRGDGILTLLAHAGVGRGATRVEGVEGRRRGSVTKGRSGVVVVIIRFMEAGESSPAQQIFIFSPSLQARVSRGKSMVP